MITQRNIMVICSVHHRLSKATNDAHSGNAEKMIKEVVNLISDTQKMNV